MKTALELLGDDDCAEPECKDVEYGWCHHEIEFVAQRAREEMREMAAQKIIELLPDNSSQAWFLRDAIRALPVKP